MAERQYKKRRVMNVFGEERRTQELESSIKSHFAMLPDSSVKRFVREMRKENTRRSQAL